MGCELVEAKTDAELNAIRLREWQAKHGKCKTSDFKLVPMCGNRDCVAEAHVRMIPTGKMKSQPLPPPPEKVVSTYRLAQIAYLPWQAPTEEETEAMALELIARRKGEA